VPGSRFETSRLDPRELTHVARARWFAQAYAKANPKGKLDTAGVKAWAIKTGTGAAEDFVSTRDGKDYIIGPGATGPVVAEVLGYGGRYVSTMEETGPKTDEEIKGLLRLGPQAAGHENGP
jgi:hypothetical protein